VSGGLASIDRNNGTLNGDRYVRGRRIFVDSKIALTTTLSLNVYYGHALQTSYAIPNKDRFDVVLSFNALKALQKAGAL